MIRRIPVFALLCAPNSPVYSQIQSAQADGPQSIEPVIVTATRSGDAVPVTLLGSSVTVIDDQAMQQRQTRVVSDVLRDVPGTAVSRTGAIGGFTQVRMRGAEGNHTLVLIDGIEASDPYSGEYDFGTLIADEDAKIEVLRGQQSSLYGSDAIGGVINYITLTGAEAPGVKLRGEGGSFGTLSAGARAAGVNDALDYALSSSFIHTRGDATTVGGNRDVGSNNLGASAKAIWTPGDAFHLTGVVRFSQTRADLNDSDIDTSSPTYGLIIDSPGVHYRNNALYGLLRGQLDQLDGKLTHALTAQVADTERTGYDVPDAFLPPAGQPIVKAYGDKGRRLKGSYEGAFRFETDAIKQRVTLAFDEERESERSTYSAFGAFLGRRHTNNFGVVGEYFATINDKLGFGASARHDDNNRFADPTTYRVQGSYKLEGGTRLHTAAGFGVKNPSFGELFDLFTGRYVGNPNLKPEKSHGWEAGVDQRFGTELIVGATYFRNHLKDQITTDFSSGVAMPINLPGKDKQQGVEVYGRARIAEQWRLDASYTWLDAPQDRTVNDDAGGATPFGGQAVRRARHIASANISWEPQGQPFRMPGQNNSTIEIGSSDFGIRIGLQRLLDENPIAKYRAQEIARVAMRTLDRLGEVSCVEDACTWQVRIPINTSAEAVTGLARRLQRQVRAVIDRHCTPTMVCELLHIKPSELFFWTRDGRIEGWGRMRLQSGVQCRTYPPGCVAKLLSDPIKIQQWREHDARLKVLPHGLTHLGTHRHARIALLFCCTQVHF